MYISAVFSQPETQHFLGANDGGCVLGVGEKDPTFAWLHWADGVEGLIAAVGWVRGYSIPSGLCLRPAALTCPAEC